MKNKHGGRRKGAGRKPASYKTVTISFRVKEEIAKELKIYIKDKILSLSDKKAPT